MSQGVTIHNWKQEDVKEHLEMKAYQISKQAVYAAWLEVKRNDGTEEVDRLSIEELEKEYKNYLYVLWNRMCSGSYLASPVRKVEIPKADGKKRT